MKYGEVGWGGTVDAACVWIVVIVQCKGHLDGVQAQGTVLKAPPLHVASNPVQGQHVLHHLCSVDGLDTGKGRLQIYMW